jgi:hypothetical protein
MEPENSDFTSDQILKIVEHHYFKTLLDQRVREIAEARLTLWRNQMVAPVVIALTVAGWLGYNNLHDVKSLTADTSKKIEDTKTKMDTTLKEVEGQREKVANLVETGKDQLEEQRKDMSTSHSLVSDATQYLKDAKNEAQHIEALQAQTVQAALNSSRDSTTRAVDLSERALELVRKAGDVDQTIRTINTTRDAVFQRKDEIDHMDQNIAAAAARVQQVERNIRDDQALRDEMIRARTFAPFILRSAQEVQVDVLDPKDPNGKQWYRVFAHADDVKSTFVLLKVRVTERWTGVSHHEEALPRLSTNSPYPLEAAPGLAIYVDSIKHQTLSHSFALLHVGPADGSH